MENSALISTVNLHVKFHECDPMQIVWHGNYLKYFEEAREAFCKKNGISYIDVKAQQISTPIVKSLCEHKLPLHYGDHFLVETSFKNTAAAKMHFTYKILKEDKIICTGETVQVFLNKSGELLLTNPPFFVAWKKKMGLL